MKLPLFTTRRGKCSLLTRTTAVVLMPTLLITCPAILNAADQVARDRADKMEHPDPVVSPAIASVNRKVPSVKAPSSRFILSAQPSDQEIFSHSLFEEPLVPIGGKTTANENAALGTALSAFSKRKERDDFSALELFLQSHPQSPWKMSLLTNLGWCYRQTGWYSKAMNAWQAVWADGQSANDPAAKATVDRALAELIVLNARVGRMDALASLLPAADSRNLEGSSKEKVEAAKQALHLMQTRPETSFRCGPMAVEKLRNLQDGNNLAKLKVMSLPSSQNGTSMAQLRKLASKLGMDYQIAKRDPGAPILAPAVVNWKVGHFATLVESKGDLWRLRDPTFGNEVWISSRALDDQSSGYFLVRGGALPKGWRLVSDQEAEKVFGKGQTSGGDPNCNGGPTPACGCPGLTGVGMAHYAIYEMLCSLTVQDTPLFYQPPYGPSVGFSVTYSQRESNQPSTFSYSNLGPLWTFNWLSYLVDDPNNPGGNVNHYLSGGGTLTYTGYDSTKGSYAPHEQTGSILKTLTASTYELDESDGSKKLFGEATTTFPRKVFMTKMIDPQGNALSFTYDSNFRLVAATDALGQVTTLSYGLSTDIYKITKVTDPFGRTALLSYTAATNGTLQSTTDMIGLVSTYNYTSGLMSSFVTPYGTTKFSVGQNNNERWVQVTDPQGGQERVETWSSTNTAIPSSVSPAPSGVDNTYLNDRNTFYWNKKAMLAAPGNYTQAQITEWLHEPGYGIMSGQVESFKYPLESRTYYVYPNQPSSIVMGTSDQPTRIARILDDGSTQQTLASYNSLNRITQQTDPVGRLTNYYYAANNVDLVQVSQQNGSNSEVQSTNTYNNQHEPITTTDASGQVTRYSYYPNGQLNTVTNPKNETTTINYTAGYLTSITGPVTGATVTFGYDGYGRLNTVTDSNGYMLTYAYDNLDRLTKVTYPDGTYDQNIYTNLDLTTTKDRQGRWTRYFYNFLQQVTSVVDSGNNVTNYDRCVCGELKAIIDGNGQRTSWNQDIEGRTLSKTYPDSTQTLYAYESNISRLKTVTDAKGQVSTYTYNADDTLHQVAYTNVAVPTPTTTYSYDPAYPRLIGIADGTGTTTYNYNPITSTPVIGAGRLGSEMGPLGSTATITYSYDAVGRVTATAINGVSSGVTYDSLGRVTDATNALGHFTYGYYGITARLHTTTYPNSQSTSLNYGDNIHDFRLSEIKNLNPSSAVLSQSDYTYNAAGAISTWQQQTDSNTPTIWNYGYDGNDQLLSAVQKNTSTQAVLAQYFYGYDSGGNRTSEQIGLSVTKNVPNGLNQLSSTSGGGPLRFTGNLNKPGTVKVGGNAASVDSNYNFSGTTTVSTGTNAVPVIAINANGYGVTNTFQVVVPASGNITPTYDLNGNLTNNGKGQTYQWDARNELTQITYASGATTIFTYDGRGRRTKIVEKNSSGGITSTKQHVWLGGKIAEERDASNAVVARFFSQGEQQLGTAYYYTRDHLGSVRELTDGSGTIKARYSYDPYGRTTYVQGSLISNFQYAGMYFHAPSSLNLTKYRAYDPNVGRWLSRDPLGVDGGLNLYAYADNNPINETDPTGQLALEFPLIILIVLVVLVVVVLWPKDPLHTHPYYSPSTPSAPSQPESPANPPTTPSTQPNSTPAPPPKVPAASCTAPPPAPLPPGLPPGGEWQSAEEYAKAEAKKIYDELEKESSGKESGTHGDILKKAGAALIRQANNDKNLLPEFRDAMKAEGKRMINKGDSMNHPGGLRQ